MILLLVKSAVAANANPTAVFSWFNVIGPGEIRLCPADVPLEWVSVLQGITPKLLSSVEKHTRELLLLEGKASTILRGARLSRGLSCSHNK